MRLYEFSGSDPLLVNLVAVIGQLKSSIDAGLDSPEWTTEELLDYLKENNIIIDIQDLYNMVKGPPLNNSIENIQGDKVVFKGYGVDQSSGEHDADKSKDIVKGMAHSAAANR